MWNLHGPREGLWKENWIENSWEKLDFYKMRLFEKKIRQTLSGRLSKQQQQLKLFTGKGVRSALKA